MSQNFKRSVRLLKKVEFQEVKKSSNKTRSLYFWGQARVLPSTCLPKLGIITTRRLGPAHERNRARRLVRELFRKNILKIQNGTSLIILPRKNILDSTYKTLEAEFIAFLGKLQTLK
ncbi:MAG: ribonuclease P protein component [Verrucomicrobia bacterium TMED44]|nr:MAG: ribonuclease P protein component [Verrucomicrobia bacterium TMED44]